MNLHRAINEGFYNRYGIEDTQLNESVQPDYRQLKEALYRILSTLDEAKMSDEDRADSAALGALYKKIGGKKTAFTKAEKELLKKYDLDAWGYMGDTKMVTPDKEDIVAGNLGHGYKASSDQVRKLDKMNLADRARKMPLRHKDSDLHGRDGSWYTTDTYQHHNNDYVSKQMTKNYNSLKWALYDKKNAQRDLDNADTGYQFRMNDQTDRLVNDTTKAAQRFQKDKDERKADARQNQADIDALLGKYRKKLESLISNLTEGVMSDEDKHDSDILRGIIDNNKRDSNFSQEEKDVLAKYGLETHWWGRPHINDKDGEPRYLDSGSLPSKWDRRGRRQNVNFADRARKLRDREDPDRKMFKTTELSRDTVNQKMGQDVRDMKNLLDDRKYNTSIDDLEKDYNLSIATAKKTFDTETDRIRRQKEFNREDAQKKLDKSNATINRILKRDVNEAYIDAPHERIVSSGLTGRVNNDILKSIIGQMSDGMWENDPNMNKYWQFVDIDPQNNFVIDDRDSVYDRYAGRGGHGGYMTNGFAHMSDEDIKTFFANKIKRLAQEELTNNNLNPFANWNEDCDFESSYLSYDQDVTIGDAYRAFKQLKGRG